MVDWIIILTLLFVCLLLLQLYAALAVDYSLDVVDTFTQTKFLTYKLSYTSRIMRVEKF